MKRKELVLGVNKISAVGQRLGAAVRALRGREDVVVQNAECQAQSPQTPRERFEPLLRQVAEQAAHDNSNHLQLILGNAQLLASSDSLSARGQQRLACILDAGREAAQTNASLLALSRLGGASNGGSERVSLGEALDTYGHLFDSLCGSAKWHCTMELACHKALPINSAPPLLLLELLLQLALRVRAFALSDSVVTLRATRFAEQATQLAADKGDTLCLRLEGLQSHAGKIGIPPADDNNASLVELATLAGGSIDIPVGETANTELVILIPVEPQSSDPSPSIRRDRPVPSSIR